MEATSQSLHDGKGIPGQVSQDADRAQVLAPFEPHDLRPLGS